MKLYGYTKSSESVEEVVELTFQCQPSELREIAKFLQDMADGIENDGENFGHGHAKDYCDNWPENSAEIIVYKPAL